MRRRGAEARSPAADWELLAEQREVSGAGQWCWSASGEACSGGMRNQMSDLEEMLYVICCFHFTDG